MSFNCVICLEDFNGRGTVVGRHRLCDECLVKGIKPKLYAALKYEYHYPPTFGAGIVLDPYDFPDFFADPRDFLQRWEERKREYETPYKERFYCAAGGHFLCSKPKKGSTDNIVCGQCDAVTCFPCGADATVQYPPHGCPGAPSEDESEPDRFNGLERGKHFQICPNAKCGTLVELKDGCNHIECAANTCKTNFCFICGGKATANSGHWSAGRPCPRHHHPDDDRHTYDDNHGNQAQIAQFLAAAHAALGRVRPHEGVDDDVPGLVDDDDPENSDEDLELNRTPPVDLFLNAIGQEEHDRLTEEAVNMINDVPALPDLTGMTEEQQLHAERNMAVDLESSNLGLLMRRQQSELDALLQVAEASAIEAENQEVDVPVWVDLGIDLMLAMRANLDSYLYRVRLRTSLQEFEDRHDFLERAYGPHQEDMFRHFRRFYEILAPYTTVAEIRLMGATMALEGTVTEDHFVRQQVAELSQMFDGIRRIRAARALFQLANDRPAGVE